MNKLSLNRALILYGAFLLAFSSFFVSAGAYMVLLDSNFSVPFNGNVTVFGDIFNSTPENLTGLNWVLNASLANNNFVHATTYNVTGTKVNATFNVSVNVSGLWGPTFLRLTASNGTFNISHSLKFRVTNTSAATVEFAGNVPPFSPGSTITAKITAKNWSGGSLDTQTINGTIYAADGVVTDWGTNSSRTNANGETLMNFSIPSDTDPGDYILTVEGGAGFIFFGIDKYVLAVTTKDSTGSNKNAFAPGSAVTVEARLKFTNDTPISGAAAKIEVTDPTNLITSSSGSTYSDGRFQYNLTASVAGTYKIKVSANGQEESGSFSARSLTATIVNRETASFFREFAGKKLFPPGQNISLTILPTNVSNGELLERGSSSYDCSQNNFTILDTYFANNQTSINSSVGSLNFIPVTHTGALVCGIEFNITGNRIGVFGIKVNVTISGGSNALAQGYFTIQRNGFSVAAASEFGEGGFLALLLPGSNASFKLSAFNITSGTALNGFNITEAYVKKITILSFSSGSSEITGLDSNFTFYNATLADGDPYVFGGPIPTVAGPQKITVMATVAGEQNLTAEAFYFGKYLMGFGQPSGTRFESEGGGHEGGKGAGMSIDCSGTTEFNVNVFDAKTFMPASSVSFLSILSAKDEITGSDISSCLTVTKGLTDSSGQAKINVTFSNACTYAGFNFVLFNVSFQDKIDSIPAGFSCQTLSMQPNTYNSLGQQRFSFPPTANITIFVQNPSYTANSSRIVVGGNMSIAALINFNPSTGATVLDAINPVIVNLTNYSGSSNGTLYIHPSYFRSAGKPLTKWPNGFFELRVKVCDNASTATKGYNGACGTSSQSGFKISAFDMWTDWFFGSNAQNTYQAGQNVSSTTVFADLAPYNIANITRIVVELIDFRSGKKYNATMVDFQNGTPAYFPLSNIENVSIRNFTLPFDIKSGEYGGIVTATNNVTVPETSDDFIFLTVRGLNIGVPLEERWSAPQGHCFPVSFYDQLWAGDQHVVRGTADGWTAGNWSQINNTYLGITPANVNGQLGFSTMVCTGPTLDTVNGFNQQSTNFTGLNVMTVSNTTHSFVFIGNRTAVGLTLNQTIRLLPTQKIPHTGNQLYLWSVEGASFIRFVNVTTLSVSGQQGQGTVNTNFAYGGSNRIRELIRIPLVAFRGSGATATRLNNFWFNITDVAEMNVEGFGIKSTLPASPNDFLINTSAPNGGNWTDFTGNLTNDDGLAFVPLNVTKAGRFMAFWKVNSTPVEKSSFKNSINFDVRAFNTRSSFVQLLPNTSKRIVLRANVTTLNNTLLGNATSGFRDDVAPALFYNGSFTETASDQFVRDGILETFYFVVLNATPQNTVTYQRGNSTTLYLDDDLMFTDSAACSASTGARSQVINELSNSACAGSSGASRNYPTMSVSSTDSRKSLSFGTAIQLGLTDWWFNSTHAILNFYESSPSIPWATVSSSTQRHGLRVCATTFSNDNKNATFALKYNNWVQGKLSASQTANITVYNITHDLAINLPSETSVSIYDGCLLTEAVPQSGSWSAGRNEIVGTATEIDNAGVSTGVQQDLFGGPIEFLSSGKNTF